MNAALAVLSLAIPCIGLLLIGWIGERNETVGRWCDALFPDTNHRGRL